MKNRQMDNYRKTFERLEAIMQEASELSDTLYAIVETDSDNFDYASIGAANKHCADDMALQIITCSNNVRDFAVSLKRNHGLG